MQDTRENNTVEKKEVSVLSRHFSEANASRKIRREEIYTKKRKSQTHIEDTRMIAQQDQQIPVKETQQKIVIIDEQLKETLQTYNFHRFSLYQKPYTQDMIHNLQQKLQSFDIVMVHEGVIGIRTILDFNQQQPLEKIMQLKVDELLIELTRCQYLQIRLEAAWALVHILYTGLKYSKIIIEKKVIEAFIELLLNNSNYHILIRGIWGLGNIASESAQLRNSVIKKGGLAAIIDTIKRCNSQGINQEGCWAISNLCSGSPLPEYFSVKEGIYIMSHMIEQSLIKKSYNVTDCLHAISQYYPFEGYIQNVTESKKLIIKVLELINHEDIQLVIASLSWLGNITSKSTKIFQFLFERKVLEILQVCLGNKNVIVREKSAWVLSNLATCNERYLIEILHSKSLLCKLFKMIYEDELRVRRQIVYIFGNMANEGENRGIEKFYVDNGIINAYFEIIKQNNTEATVSVLNNLYNMLNYAEQRYGEENIIVGVIKKNSYFIILEQLQLSDQNVILYEINKILTVFSYLKVHPDMEVV